MKTINYLRKTERLQYEIFRLNSLNEMAKMVAQAFIYSDPMAVVQRFTVEEFVHYVYQLGAGVAEQGLTVIVRERQTNKIVGVVIAGDFFTDSSLDIKNLDEDKFQLIMQLFARLKMQYTQGKQIGRGEYLHLHMLAVIPEWRGEKIAQSLTRICTENAASVGYRITFTEAANSISQRVFRNCGFVERHEILYKQYTYQNVPIFAGIERHSGVILMDKTLMSTE